MSITSRVAAPVAPKRPLPEVYGICRYNSSTVETVSASTAIMVSRAGPAVGSRRGHSAKSTSAGPTSRTSPAKPMYRAAESAIETVGSVLTGWLPSSAGVAVTWPTEYVKPPLIGWLSAEMTR